ncbi:MAG: hypothetical protein ACOC6G_03265 [Thermoproteota archaeon]
MSRCVDGIKMGKQVERGRGRPPDSEHSYKTRRILEYLARIAVKYEVDSKQIFEGVVEAWNHKEAECGPLLITCRKKKGDSANFLLLDDQKVIGQIPLPREVLREDGDPLNPYMAAARSRKGSSVKGYEGKNPKIENLEAGMKKINLKAKVMKVPEPKMVYTRFGNTAYVSNALIADETGSIRMSLWNKQVQTVSEGDMIHIENSKVTRFRGERQLRIGRRGSFSVIK